MLLITSWSPWGNDLVGVDGILDFDALHSGKHNGEIQLCAFDVLAMDGDNLRKGCDHQPICRFCVSRLLD